MLMELQTLHIVFVLKGINTNLVEKKEESKSNISRGVYGK